MNLPGLTPPAPGEHAPFYAGYVAGVADADVGALLERQPVVLREACGRLSDAEARFRYAPGKWSVKEVIGHLADTERVFAYRALRIGRGDATPLPGFDENAFAAAAGSDARPLEALLADFVVVRASTRALLEGFGPEAWERRGTTNGAPMTLRAQVYVVAGHVRHHLRILGERYGLTVPME